MFLAFVVGVAMPMLVFIASNELQADVDNIEPNGDGTTISTHTTCGGGGAYDCLDDGVTAPTAPSTSGDYLTLNNTENDFYLMETIGNVATVTAITIQFYHVEGGTNAYGTLGLFAADEVTQYGSTQNITNRSIAQWDTATFSGLTLTQAQLDGLRVRFDCEKTGGGKSNTCTGYALYAEVTYIPKTNVLVDTTGTQQNIDVGATDAYVGGAFSLIENENCTSCTIDSITITESGTINAQTNLDNIKLFYDLDTIAPYDCASESYGGSESQFGSTDTDGFSGANGTAAFTGSVSVSTTQAMCVYTVLDIGAGAASGDTIELEIADPSVDVSTTNNDIVRPTTTVAISGSTVIQAVELDQIHYHWRNDNGDEGDSGSGATSATGGTEDTAYSTLSKGTPTRLRLEVSNEGNKTASTTVEILNDFTTGNKKTVASGTRRLLLVGIHSEDSGSNVDVNTVTYGGQTLTEVRDEQVTTTFSNGMWVGYLDEAGLQATVGTTTIATWNGGTPDEAVLYSSVVFENVDQRNPISGWSANSGSSISTIQPTSSIAVSGGDYAAYFTISGSAGQTHTAAAGYTEGTEQDSNSVAANASKQITAAGSEQPTADWTNTQNRLAIVAVAVQGSNVYRLEYAQKVTTCSVATGWTDVGASGGAFDMYDSSNLTHGNDTTNIAVSSGGVTNENTTFLTPNSGVLDTSSYSSEVTLTASEYVEFEYALEATANSVEGNTYCFRLTLDSAELDTYTAYPETTILADVNVSAEGTQPEYIDIPDTGVLMGGFNIIGQTPGRRTISSTTITATGTANYVTELDNIQLLYDLDTTSPYNCASESYGGGEAQYGSTDTDGFTPTTGTSTFTGTVYASTTQAVCMYVVLDVVDTAADGGTLEIEIANASTDVETDSGTVSPSALVAITGSSTLVKAIPTLTHYHWRDDLGSETTAPSATGDEDTALGLWKRGIQKRLRLGVSNEGSTTTTAYQYRLEYATKVSTCSAATGWTDVGAAGGEFDMYNSANLTDGDDTTNIGTSTGGVTDEAASFLTNNNAVKDTSSQTAGITLLGDQFVELEYSLVASSTAVEGKTYCFRVTNAGTEISAYDTYAEATIKPPTDFFIQRGVSTITGTSLTITAGVDYVAPASSSTAFVRITNTQHTGAGDNAPPANNNADDVTVYISNPGNITTSVDFVRHGASGNTRVDWEIIEFTGAPSSNNEMIVREQSFITFGGTALAATTSAVSNIQDDSDVVVFITGQGNPDTGRTNYNTSLATAAWNAGADTATFTRGEAGSDALDLSYAIVEFVGSNWQIQRTSHTYTSAGSTETESITSVNSLSRAFLHTQKRAGSGLNTHADIGHEVWLSGIGQVSFYLDNQASTPGSHTSVAWVIENTQTNGTPMDVTRSNGTHSGGAEPSTLNISIGKTLNDTEIASIFINNRSSGAVTTFPQPIIAARLLNTTQYELWISKTSDTRNYRTEIVEWPTGAREISQNYYRFYADNDALDPTDPWPVGAADVGENTAITIYDEPIAIGETARLRMTLAISAAKMNPGVDTFKLQYGQLVTTCTALSESDWHDVADSSSTTALWRAHAGTPTDGTALSGDPPTAGDLNISVADVAGTYEEDNPTAAVPFQVDPGEDVEYDWAVENNAAIEKVSYCFRMVESDGTLFEAYTNYPTIRTAGYTPVLSQWRFYDDETNLTPTTPLADENTAPIDIANDNLLKLRVTVAETTGGDGADNKFKLQFSEYSDFSQAVYDVVATSTCTDNSRWCYADGAGVDQAVIDAAVLSDADSCTGGVGDGCAIHNESATTTGATYDQPALSVAEYEFTIEQAGARVNAVYYFRLYDLNNATTVVASTTNPSVVTEGAALTFTVNGLTVGTVTEGITTDATTTATAVTFGSVPVDTEHEAAQRLTVNTNATEGYQILAYSTGSLLNSYGTAIDAVTGTNNSPSGWSTGCAVAADGCFGYHSGDDLLAGGSTRFAPIDSYAALTTSPLEIAYSSVPVSESHDIVYKVQVSDEQPAGTYESNIVYLAIPVF